MSVADAINRAAFKTQKRIYGDPIFFKDEEGNFTIESVGIFKSDYSFTDSITQQQVISEEPTIWVERPTVVPIVQGTQIKWKESYFQVKELHNDVDHEAYNLLLHEIAAPEEAPDEEEA